MPGERDLQGDRDLQGVVLPGTAASPGAARRLVRGAMAELDLPDAVQDTVLLLTSEVVTNAVLHTRGELRVDVADAESGGIRVEVSDTSPTLPRRQDYGLDVTTGRGMRLLSSLATEWGTDLPAAVDGFAKTVWFEIDAAAADTLVDGVGSAFVGLDAASWLDGSVP